MSWESKVQNLLGHCTSHATFGSDLLHIPQIGDVQTFKGIWSDTYAQATPEDGVVSMSDDPNIGARLSDFIVQPQKNDQIERYGIRYRIRAPEPDGEGGVVLLLERLI